MRILITGINGFLGKSVAKALYHTHDLCGTYQNNNDISYLSNILFLQNNTDNIEAEIIRFSPDTIIHFAWKGGNSYLDINNPLQFYDNIPSTIRLMDLSIKSKIKHFIGIGTIMEYGNQNRIVSESDKECPIDLYGTCKTMTKLYSEQFCRLNNIKWTWIRPSYIYGTDDILTRLIPKTIEKCLTKQKLILNSCDSVADYLYIDDFISAIIKIIDSHLEGIYNICSNKQYTIRTIVESIGKKTNNMSNITFDSTLDRIGFPKFICASNRKLKMNTGWRPVIDMDTGLTNIIAELKQ